jgi:hypothetical protein
VPATLATAQPRLCTKGDIIDERLLIYRLGIRGFFVLFFCWFKNLDIPAQAFP